MKTSRRRFIQSSLALPALAWWPSSSPRIQTQKDSFFDPWVEIHSAHLKHNLGEIGKRVESRPILAVIKNNGYGLGLVNVAKILEPDNKVFGFAVVKLQEAVALRDAGVKKPILLMGPFNEQELEETADRDISQMVYTDIGSIADGLAKKRGTPIDIHLCVDTGIGRVGVPYKLAENLLRALSKHRSVAIQGVMMTFTEDPEFDKEQFDRFRFLCERVEKAGIQLGKKHAVSSFGLFQHADKFLDMVRPGMAVYGIYPEKEFRGTGIIDLRPAVSFKTRVIFAKQLLKGESAGYNRAFVAEEDVWVATLPVGHADGLPRSMVKGARVRIGDDLYAVVAISASHCIVNLGAHSTVKVGDVVTIFDWQEGSRPEDIAVASDSSVYDLTMHLNPLLPRKIL